MSLWTAPVSSTPTVKVYAPDSVGVPVIAPDEGASDNPGGKVLPDENRREMSAAMLAEPLRPERVN